MQVVEVADEVRELFRTLIRLHVRKGTIKVLHSLLLPVSIGNVLSYNDCLSFYGAICT